MRVLMLGVVVSITAIWHPAVMADDQQIADFIKARLIREKQQGNLYGFNVDMRVDQGTVWFKGFVSNRAQELLILRTAQLAGHLGVVQVVDDIEVTNPYDDRGTTQPANPTAIPPNQYTTYGNGPMQSHSVMQPRPTASNPGGPMSMPAMGDPMGTGTMQMRYQPSQVPNRTGAKPMVDPRQPMTTPGMPNQPNVSGPTTAPRSPYRMERPMSSSLPEPDANTKMVAYQEPIMQPQMALPFSTSSAHPGSTMYEQPSFQDSLMNNLRLQQTSMPMADGMSSPMAAAPASGPPLPFARAASATQGCIDGSCGYGGVPMASSYDGGYAGGNEGGYAATGMVSESANLPGYAWPAYASHPNYGAVSYPKQYSASAWPYIGPFYPYPQVPLGWRKVSLEWDDGWWFLDFHDKN